MRRPQTLRESQELRRLKGFDQGQDSNSQGKCLHNDLRIPEVSAGQNGPSAFSERLLKMMEALHSEAVLAEAA
jgi:hypothetical protein